MDLSNAPRRSRMMHLALAAVLGVALVGLTQCRNVADSLTGTEVSQGRLAGRSDCVRACNDKFQAGVKSEQAVHKAAAHACGDDSACHDAEGARHEAAMEALSAAMNTCKNSCYNEGSGGTGF